MRMSLRTMGRATTCFWYFIPMALRELMQLVRTGLYRDGSTLVGSHALAVDLQALIRDAIASAKNTTTYGDPTLLVEDIDQLKLCCLEAESYYQHGNITEAVAVLTPVWLTLKPHLDKSPQRPFQQKPDSTLLRQKLWALLHYVFYKYYTLE